MKMYENKLDPVFDMQSETAVTQLNAVQVILQL